MPTGFLVTVGAVLAGALCLDTGEVDLTTTFFGAVFLGVVGIRPLFRTRTDCLTNVEDFPLSAAEVVDRFDPGTELERVSAFFCVSDKESDVSGFSEVSECVGFCVFVEWSEVETSRKLRRVPWPHCGHLLYLFATASKS